MVQSRSVEILGEEELLEMLEGGRRVEVVRGGKIEAFEGVLPGTDFPMEIRPLGCHSDFHTKFHPTASRSQLRIIFTSNSIFTLCLGCNVMLFEHPEGLAKPEWVGMYEKRSERNFVSATMEKRRKAHVCVLCGVAGERKVSGVLLCGPHAVAVEEKGL